MMTKETLPIDPMPVNDAKLDLREDFCACIVDPKINDRDISLTKLKDEPTTETEES